MVRMFGSHQSDLGSHPGNRSSRVWLYLLNVCSVTTLNYIQFLMMTAWMHGTSQRTHSTERLWSTCLDLILHKIAPLERNNRMVHVLFYITNKLPTSHIDNQSSQSKSKTPTAGKNSRARMKSTHTCLQRGMCAHWKTSLPKLQALV